MDGGGQAALLANGGTLKSPARGYRMSDETRDSNGSVLADGDNVTLIKDLKVKGTSVTLKRGTLVKGIRLTGNTDEIDCKVDKVKGLVLRTEFVRKA
ncbi:alkylphosphonate utilization protein [Sandarakinorhabdus glacialis]